MRPPPSARARPGWLLAAVLASGCGDDPPALVPAAEPEPPSDPAAPGKVQPAPASELAFGRAVLEALRGNDWDGYTNLLATRADMIGLYADEDRGVGRELRKRRRMVWRRVNRLRDGEAEEGWSSTRSQALADGIAWDAVRLVDVRREPVVMTAEGDLPPETTAARLVLVLEHQGAQRALALGTCVRSSRGWVALYPLAWQELGPGLPRGESLLAPDR
jgi:hypothetical protein